MGIAVVGSSHVVMTPFCAETVLIWSVAEQHLTHSILPERLRKTFMGDNTQKFGQAVAVGNTVYASPYNSDYLFTYEHAELWTGDSNVDNRASGIHVSNSLKEYPKEKAGKWFGIAHYDNKIYCVPAQHGSMLVYDLDVSRGHRFREVKIAAVPQDIPNFGIPLYTSATMIESTIYAMPAMSIFGLLMFETISETANVRSIDTRTDQGWIGITAVKDHHAIYGAPFTADDILVYTVPNPYAEPHAEDGYTYPASNCSSFAPEPLHRDRAEVEQKNISKSNQIQSEISNFVLNSTKISTKILILIFVH